MRFADVYFGNSRSTLSNARFLSFAVQTMYIFPRKVPGFFNAVAMQLYTTDSNCRLENEGTIAGKKEKLICFGPVNKMGIYACLALFNLYTSDSNGFCVSVACRRIRVPVYRIPYLAYRASSGAASAKAKRLSAGTSTRARKHHLRHCPVSSHLTE